MYCFVQRLDSLPYAFWRPAIRADYELEPCSFGVSFRIAVSGMVHVTTLRIFVSTAAFRDLRTAIAMYCYMRVPSVFVGNEWHDVSFPVAASPQLELSLLQC